MLHYVHTQPYIRDLTLYRFFPLTSPSIHRAYGSRRPRRGFSEGCRRRRRFCHVVHITRRRATTTTDAVETDDEDEDACVRVFGMARARDEDEDEDEDADATTQRRDDGDEGDG